MTYTYVGFDTCPMLRSILNSIAIEMEQKDTCGILWDMANETLEISYEQELTESEKIKLDEIVGSFL